MRAILVILFLVAIAATGVRTDVEPFPCRLASEKGVPSQFSVGLHSARGVHVGDAFHEQPVLRASHVLHSLTVHVDPEDLPAFESRLASDENVRYCEQNVYMTLE